MFGAHGYAAVSMRDLAAELNVKAPSLYSHFPSKADILLACIYPLVDGVDELLAEAPAVPVPDGQVREWLTAYIELNARHAAAATILTIDQAARAEPEVASLVLQQSLRLEAMLEQFGSPDRTTTIAVMGAACLPVARGALLPMAARQLATRLLYVLRPPALVGWD
jgi:AcrR family transcriptional regulator